MPLAIVFINRDQSELGGSIFHFKLWGNNLQPGPEMEGRGRKTLSDSMKMIGKPDLRAAVKRNNKLHWCQQRRLRSWGIREKLGLGEFSI